jgi:PIN domain nuclease of toxin-antitoxin system
MPNEPVKMERKGRLLLIVAETWTRDPFDRLIVAQAKAGEGKQCQQ